MNCLLSSSIFSSRNVSLSEIFSGFEVLVAEGRACSLLGSLVFGSCTLLVVPVLLEAVGAWTCSSFGA